MTRYPVKANGRKLRRKIDDNAVQVIERPTAPFFSFRYSYTEISLDPAPRVKSRKASFEDGKLVSESFEGELDRNVYEKLVGDAARFFLSQTASLTDSFLQFVPFAPKSRHGRE